MQIVIPMAGLGSRFADAGYALPKPLIPVGGVPMVVRVVQNLPAASRVVFVAHPEHAAKYPLADILRRHVPESVVTLTPGLTAGQACTTRLAVDHLDPDEDVLVAACDSTQVYDAAKWNAVGNDRSVSAAAWVFRGDPRVLVKPTAYGWTRESGGVIREVSVKRPVSDSPLADGVITGTFWFRTAGLMADGIDALVTSGQRVNNEFYLDSVPDVLTAAGHKVIAFDIDKYIGWGTPADFEDYLRWERHFAARAA